MIRAASHLKVRFIQQSLNPTKNTSANVWLGRFEYNTTQAFILEFGEYYIRFYSDHGVVLDGDNNTLEITSPWNESALTNDDGSFGLSMVQSGDVVYICTYSALC
ncbi:hypothetical protein [Candidatus Sodalis pierantonius]|uniref:hypothetical protein n=1 Tax=Candidatus Sodalis pierantonii TaxID=1486991 RepID=UPI00130E15FD|nr:hypothetical protein [Candidatus Sodalis pierantonius]